MNDDLNDFFCDEIPDVEWAAIYRRFAADPRSKELISALRRRGMSDHEIEIAFRLISASPHEWRKDSARRGQKAVKRARLAKTPHALAREAAEDPNLAGFCFDMRATYLRAPENDRGGLISLPELMAEGAREIEDALSEDAVIVDTPCTNQPQEFEPSLALKKYTIREIFALIERPKGRAPNKETAALASILLEQPVTANDVTQARKSERRRYFREKK